MVVSMVEYYYDYVYEEEEGYDDEEVEIINYSEDFINLSFFVGVIW